MTSIFHAKCGGHEIGLPHALLEELMPLSRGPGKKQCISSRTSSFVVVVGEPRVCDCLLSVEIPQSVLRHFWVISRGGTALCLR